MTTNGVMSDFSTDDQHSLEQLLGQAVWLQRCALRMGYAPESAEDAVQETLVQALQSKSRFGAGWLRRTLQRQLGMQWRAERRRVQREHLSARPEATDLDPAGPLEQLELHGAIQSAIGQLPRRDREVLALRFAADLSVQEIATSLGQSPNAISSRLSRALQRLRSMLGPAAAPDNGRRRFGWLSLPLGSPMRSAGPGLSTSAASGPAFLITCLTIPMKMSLIALVLVALVALGAQLLSDTPASHSLDRQANAAPENGPGAPPGLAPGFQLAGPTEDDSPGERAASAGAAPSAPEQAPDQAAPETGRVRVYCQELGTGNSVAGIAIELRAKSYAMQTLDRCDVLRTGGNGEVLFSGLEPGTYAAALTLYGGGLNWATAEVRAGETVEIWLEVDPEQEVRGYVVDEAGTPVPDAVIWTGHRPGPVETGHPVGKSGTDGEFLLKYVGQDQFLCARAAHYAPSLSASPSFDVNYTSDGLRLVLGARRGAVKGTVRSPSGQPQPDVLVSVGERIMPAPGPGFRWTPIPQDQRTDAAGAFAFDDVRVGEVTLRARAPKTALWSRVVSVVESGTVDLAIELRAGGTLTGLVRSADGEPSPGASVSAFTGSDADFVQVVTRADVDGRFRLTGVSPGQRTLEAASQDGKQMFREALHIDDAADQVWNPVLSTARNIDGSVVSPSGAPLRGWYVSAHPDKDGVAAAHSTGATVLADGTFSIQAQPGDAYTLRVYPPGRFHGPEALLLEGFLPRGEPVTLLVPRERIPNASIRGQLVNGAGEALAGKVTLEIETNPVTRIHRTTSPDGRFRFQYLPEGAFTLTLERAGFGTEKVSSNGDLVPDEVRDLGQLTLKKQ